MKRVSLHVSPSHLLSQSLSPSNPFQFDGGWLALGGSSYHFHKELPALSKYEIHMSVSSWDQKWLYLTAKFVSVSNKPKRHRRKLSQTRSAQNLMMLAKEVVTPAHDVEKMKKLEKEKDEKLGKIEAETENEEDAGREEVEKNSIEGRTLYCTAISRYCFKSGRKTIPPWLVICSSGYGQRPSTRENWDKVSCIRAHFNLLPFFSLELDCFFLILINFLSFSTFHHRPKVFVLPFLQKLVQIININLVDLYLEMVLSQVKGSDLLES